MATLRIRLMTFNLRFDNPVDTEAGHGWADRLESVVETITTSGPDVVGAQEAIVNQLDDLSLMLPEYQCVGRPREAAAFGEFVPLLFRRDRLALAHWGDFWLSLTPDTQGSIGWDADNPRHCTWAVLDDGESGSRFAVFNTHLDRWGTAARLEGARLITAKRVLAGDLPYVVMGDLNSTEDSEPLALLRAAGLTDAYRAVHPDEYDVATVHHYAGPYDGDRIDYILVDSHWEVLDAQIVRQPAAGRLPSDHFPVIVDVALR